MLRARRLVFQKWTNTPIWKLIWGKHPYITPLKLGRMNGRHDGYNVQFSMIDEMHLYGRNEYAEVLLHHAPSDDRRNP